MDTPTEHAWHLCGLLEKAGRAGFTLTPDQVCVLRDATAARDLLHAQANPASEHGILARMQKANWEGKKQ